MSFPLKSLSTKDITEQILPIFLDAYKDETPPMEPEFARDLLILLVRYDGINGFVKEAYNAHMVQAFSICKLEQFLEKCFERCTRGIDATLCHIRLLHYFRQAKLKHLSNVKKKFDKEHQQQANVLLQKILQYPETSNPCQLDEMIVQMLNLIISCHHLGSPKDHVLQSQTRQSLKCIIRKKDLANYILKTQHNRLEYMQRLAATTGGIVIHSNYPPGEKEHFWNVIEDLHQTKARIKDILRENINRVNAMIEKAHDLYSSSFSVKSDMECIHYFIPMRKLLDVNAYICLFLCYKRCMNQLMELLMNTDGLSKALEKKFHCVMTKIDNILRYRMANKAEKIFPHFYYLSQLWTTIACYLEHFHQLNEIRDGIDQLVNKKIFGEYQRIFVELESIIKALDSNPIAHNVAFDKIFQEMHLEIPADKQALIMSKVFESKYLEMFCCWSMMLTGGLLTPSKMVKKFLNKYDYGFGSYHSMKMAQMDNAEFMRLIFSTILRNLDLVLLFEVDQILLKEELKELIEEEPPIRSKDTQTDHLIYENKIPPSKWIQHTWNIWDYHRETIFLANLRRKQTHGWQTKLTYGRRNAQIQMYNTQSHKSIQNSIP